MSYDLPPRLKAIASHIDKNAAVADVGTDHGLLPVYLAKNNLTRSIIAADISADSLASARRFSAKYSVSHMITFMVADGLAGVGEADADTIVAAGIGGETIAGILKAAPWTKNRGVKLILQPQTKTCELCVWLRENGYAVRDAELTRDNGRIYLILIAEGKPSAEDNASGNGGINANREKSGIDKEADPCTVPESALLAILRNRRDPLLARYLETLIDTTRKAAEGMAKSKTADNAVMLKRLDELMGLQESLQVSLTIPKSG